MLGLLAPLSRNDERDDPCVASMQWWQIPFKIPRSGSNPDDFQNLIVICFVQRYGNSSRRSSSSFFYTHLLTDKQTNI